MQELFLFFDPDSPLCFFAQFLLDFVRFNVATANEQLAKFVALRDQERQRAGASKFWVIGDLPWIEHLATQIVELLLTRLARDPSQAFLVTRAPVARPMASG